MDKDAAHDVGADGEEVRTVLPLHVVYIDEAEEGFIDEWPSEDEAVAYLTRLDALSVKENFFPNVGPAMMHDSDNPATMRVLERALSTLPNIEGSRIIAGDDGIHWITIHRTAELVKYVAEHSPRAQGTFNFTATAILKPLAPFYPGAYHISTGRQFAIGFCIMLRLRPMERLERRSCRKLIGN